MIVITNPDGVEHGVKSLIVNGKEMSGSYIKKELLTPETLVEVRMG